ncbi:MAG: hypothetical protein H3Z52_13575 [archaeon]|nr:hypothetical protein [archaeon]
MEREVLSEIKEVKERLSVIEYLLRANLIPEVKPTADEKRAIREFERDLHSGREKLIPLEEVLKTTGRETNVAVSRRAEKKGR